MDLMQMMLQLQQNPQMVDNLANSADGQNLMKRLDSQKLNEAAVQGQNGNYMEMAKLLRSVMGSPDGKALLERMAKQLGK